MEPLYNPYTMAIWNKKNCHITEGHYVCKRSVKECDLCFNLPLSFVNEGYSVICAQLVFSVSTNLMLNRKAITIQ